MERRWIVTGTPTTNLLGLSFGTKSGAVGDSRLDRIKAAESKDIGDTEKDFRAWEVDEESDEMMDVDETQMGSSTGRESSLPLSPAFVNSSLPTAEAHQTLSEKRVWNRYDRADLIKLGNMITHFIAVPQFHADPKLVASHVIEPLLDSTGPRPGSIQVLNQVMEMIMIRHRYHDLLFVEHYRLLVIQELNMWKLT